MTCKVMVKATVAVHRDPITTEGAAMRLVLPAVVLAFFVPWSLWLVHDEGLMGLFTLLRDNDWGAQVFADLSVALVVAWSLLWPLARAQGVSPWPYVLITPSIGSPALLLCLIHLAWRTRGPSPR
jgi:hypothetical protein